jgi:hypothetical protein
MTIPAFCPHCGKELPQSPGATPPDVDSWIPTDHFEPIEEVGFGPYEDDEIPF